LACNHASGQCSIYAQWFTMDCNLNCGASANSYPSGQAPFTYLWSNGQTTQNATGLCDNTNYTVTVTDANGCTSTAIASIYARPNVWATVTQQPSCPTCCDGVVTGSANGSSPACMTYMHSWDNVQIMSYNQPITGVCPGIHVYCRTFDCGCTICDSVMVYPICSATATQYNPDCYGNCNGSMICTPSGQSPFTYLWSNGQTTQIATGLCANSSYTVTVTDAGGCSSMAYNYVYAPTQLYYTYTPPSCFNCCDGALQYSTATMCGPIVSSWDNTPNPPSPMNNICAGNHILCVTDACGCMICDTINFSVTTSMIPLNADNEFDIRIFPNPTDGLFQVNSAFDVITYSVYNMQGKQILTERTKGVTKILSIDLSTHSNGLYFVQISTVRGISSKRVVVAH
jgi:hypothetical protein